MDLRAALRERQIIAPGVYDALTASVAAASGFEALYLSGGAIAYTRLGRPDIGLVSMNEVVEVIALVRDRVDLPLIVDADNGYGNALNVQRTVRMFERAGANAIQLEDQTLPKRCGHLRDKTLISTGEMMGKVRAAVDARASEATLIVARTDAVAVEGLNPRSSAPGATPRPARTCCSWKRRRAGRIWPRSAARWPARCRCWPTWWMAARPRRCRPPELDALGFRLVIFPGGIVRTLLRTMSEYYGSLAFHKTNRPFAGRMLTFTEMNAVLGTPAMLALGKSYQGG